MNFTCDKCKVDFPVGQKRVVVANDKVLFKLCINCFATFVAHMVDWIKS